MQRAQAQDAPVAAPTPAEAPAPAPETTTPPVAEPVVTATPAVPAPVEEMPPAVPVEEEPAPEEANEARMPMSVGLWAHLGTTVNGAEDKLDRLNADGELNLLFSADLIEHFAVVGNLVGTYGNDAIAGGVSVMDLHGKIGVDDAFNIWIGRMLVPSDRANFSGVWFAAPWTYPGLHLAGAPPVGPRQGPSGRNDGLTFWGQFGGGLFKYYAGVYDLHETTGKALFSGRLNLALISPEPGYYHSSTYYGSKDILAIGIGGQYEKDGSTPMGATETDDYSEFNADVLFEKNFGEGGVLDLEGAVYKYMGDGEAIDYSFLLLASWMTADKIGIGKIQPLVRFQQAKPTADGADSSNLIDAQLGYIIDGYATRFALGFTYQKFGDIKDNQIYLGLQLQK